MLGYILALILTGLVIGALGRLAVPGRNPMGILMTILIGIGGSLLGGLVSRQFGIVGALSFIIAVLCAAALVYLVSGASRRGGLLAGGGRRGLL